ncbi:hypothetical protein NEMBOFW57_001952 [Staphylotrichum longicolle]|uniref:Uncharacterized protein n=1 Tax=Staphylotrichum longicolle TaxID=669026 RepID=A0AAD4F333_9PEZI|nr:hypothetical protein NEMBOFW57_001952 [Staphylotrichum longicolle]
MAEAVESPKKIAETSSPLPSTRLDFDAIARLYIERDQKDGQSLAMIRSDNLWELHHNTNSFDVKASFKRKFHTAIIKQVEQLILGALRFQDDLKDPELEEEKL